MKILLCQNISSLTIQTVWLDDINATMEIPLAKRVVEKLNEECSNLEGMMYFKLENDKLIK